MDVRIVIGLLVWLALITLVVCAAILGGRLDDRTEQDAGKWGL